MDFRYPVKQMLRMCGHAFVSTVHERMDAMDRRVANLLDQNTSLARTQTALLQSCVHVVETLQRVEAEFSRQAQDTRERIEQFQAQQAASLQSSAEQTRELIQQLQAQQAASLRSWSEQTRQLLEQPLGMGDELRQRLARLVTEESGDHQTQLQLCRVSVERLTRLTDEQTAVREQIAALSQMREQFTSFVRDVRSFLEHEVPSQICVETADYAFTNPEIGLMSFLYSHLPGRKALDIGAHVGEVAEHLLRTGYEVFAFEPFSASYAALVERLKGYPQFHPHNIALGRIDAELPLHLATDLSADRKYDTPTAFHSLNPHSMPDDLPFSGSVLVPVRSLAGLQRDNIVPADISLVKIDTEGYDLEVVRGMGECRYPVVAVEYWDTEIPFGKSGLLYTLGSMSEEMRQRGYGWSIVLYRIWGRNQTAFYCNHNRSVPQSWGNIFFFRDYETFAHAQRWCAAVLPRTYFKPVAGK